MKKRENMLYSFYQMNLEVYMEDTLNTFKAYLKRRKQFDQAQTMLAWDMQTAAPKDSVESKIESIGFFSTESFRMSTAKEYGELLEELSKPEQLQKLDEGMAITVKRERKKYTRFQRVPEAFYTEFVKEKARSEHAWEEAKEKDDFSIYEPHLDKIISMTKEFVHYIEPDKDVYEVLLDMYEEGMDGKTIDTIFTELKEGLKPLIEKITSRPQPDLSTLKGRYDIQAQKKVQDLLLDYIGFNFERGTTAESVHPFTITLCHGDVRVTNSYDEEAPISSMFSAIHEGGHAIFEQNVDETFKDTAVEEIELMGLHESQSRFYENMLGRNKNFWIPIYDKVVEILPQLKNVPLNVFMQAINVVKPSLIRVDADEVTYCMHIILRYEMEKAIFIDHVPTKELPQLWNQKMEELLGVVPQSDAQGIMQDMHWSDGSFGYFPSYLLGSVYDGMLLEQVEEELGSVDQILADGRIKELTLWLNEKIHQYGSLYTSKEVMERVCHKEISAQPLLTYFRKKYE